MTQTTTAEVVINIHRNNYSRARIRVGLCVLLYLLGFTLSAMAESEAPAEQTSKEQRWIEEKKQSRDQLSTTAISSKQRIAARRYEIRCTKLNGAAALLACNEGLRDFPKNLHLLNGKGDALMALSRYGEALKAYQAAQGLAPKNQISKSGILKAQFQRDVQVKKCLKLDGLAAMSACDSALLHGTEDEFAIRLRQGDLFKAANQNKKATSAYQAALAINPQDVTLVRKLKLLGLNRDKEETSTPVRAEANAKPASEPKMRVAKQLQTVQQKLSPTRVKQKKDLAQASLTTTKLISKVENQTAPAPPQKTTSLNLTEKPRTLFSNAPLPSGFTY